MNFELARSNMVAQQLRTWEVLDDTVLRLFSALPREHFVPPAYLRLAYSDTEIPLANGEVMMAPKVEARMLQALAPQAQDRCLEIGTGSGFVTALLARSVSEVFSMEIDPDLLAMAKTRLRGYDRNVTTLEADGLEGLPEQAPFDLMVFTGAIAEITPAQVDQLNLGGRLFAVVGTGSVFEARLVTRIAENETATEVLFETHLPYLRGAAIKPRFTL